MPSRLAAGVVQITFKRSIPPPIIRSRTSRHDLACNWVLRANFRMAATKYPSREEITALFKNMETGNYPAMFSRVSKDVDWTVMGTHSCAGRYTTLEGFQHGTLARLGKLVKEPGIRLMVRNVIGGGDQEWANVELVAVAEGLNGELTPCPA